MDNITCTLQPSSTVNQAPWQAFQSMADGFGSYINVAFKLAEFCLKLQAAPEETVVFGRLIDRVRTDRAEALRERKAKTITLEDFPEKRRWIDKTLQDTNDALQTIGQLVESARIDTAKGQKLSLQHRFEWVLKKKEDFLAKQSLLATCHQSLSTVIIFMQALHERMPASKAISSPPPPAYVDDAAFLRAPSARRPRPRQAFVLPSSPTEESGLAGTEALYCNTKGAASCVLTWRQRIGSSPLARTVGLRTKRMTSRAQRHSAVPQVETRHGTTLAKTTRHWRLPMLSTVWEVIARTPRLLQTR